jgi:hypothetical protein
LAMVVPAAYAIKGPIPTDLPTTPVASNSCNNNNEPAAFLSSAFGVSKRLPTVLSMRGGEVLEPETLEGVESILLKAGSENKLVVVDFSASWYVHYT